MQLNLKASKVTAMASEALIALEPHRTKRLAQIIRVQNMFAFASEVSPTANILLDMDDYVALTQLPREA